MIPIHDFVVAAAKYKRRLHVFVIWFVPALMTTFVVIIAIPICLYSGDIDRSTIDTIRTYSWPVVLAPWLILLGAGAFMFRPGPNLRCPHCRCGMHHQAPWTIATRNCGACGQRMLDEPAVENLPMRFPVNAPDLGSAGLLEIRRELTWVVVSMVAMFACAGLAAGFLVWLRTSRADGTAEWLTSVTAASLIMIVEFLVWWRWGSRRADRSMRCPSCGESLLEFASVVLDTGNCGHCGRHILAVSPNSVAHAPASGTKQLTIEEFRQACRAWSWKAALLALIGVGVLIGGMGLGVLLLELLPGGNKRPPEGWFSVLAFAPTAVALLAFLIVLSVVLRRRDTRLICPNCKTDLAKIMSLVIATRSCVQCRRRVLAEPSLSGADQGDLMADCPSVPRN